MPLAAEADALLNIINEESNGNSCINQIETAYLEYAEKRFLNLLRASFQIGLGKEILDAYNTLPPTHRVRLHLSTEMSVYLDGFDFNGKRLETFFDKAQKILSTIKRESLIANVIFNKKEDILSKKGIVWSPFGDVYLEIDSDNQSTINGQLVLSNGSILDYESPIATATNPTSGTLSQPSIEHTQSELVMVSEKLEQALVLLEAYNPVYRKIVDTFAKRVVLRKSAENYQVALLNGRTISSDHTTSHFGCIRFLNFHFKEKSISSCAESLLHESLHVMLSSWERIHGDFSYKGKDVRAISPWSGNLIPDSSFSHATIIYYCCLKLYAALMRGKSTLVVSEGDKIKCRLMEIIYGFLISDNLLHLFGKPDKISKDYCSIANKIHKAVISNYNCNSL